MLGATATHGDAVWCLTVTRAHAAARSWADGAACNTCWLGGAFQPYEIFAGVSLTNAHAWQARFWCRARPGDAWLDTAPKDLSLDVNAENGAAWQQSCLSCCQEGTGTPCMTHEAFSDAERDTRHCGSMASSGHADLRYAVEGGMGASLSTTDDVIPGIGGAAAAPRMAAFEMDPSVPGMPCCCLLFSVMHQPAFAGKQLVHLGASSHAYTAFSPTGQAGNSPCAPRLCKLLRERHCGAQMRPAARRSAALCRRQPSQGGLASLQVLAGVCLHPGPQVVDPLMLADHQLAGELAGLDTAALQAPFGAACTSFCSACAACMHALSMCTWNPLQAGPAGFRLRRPCHVNVCKPVHACSFVHTARCMPENSLLCSRGPPAYGQQQLPPGQAPPYPGAFQAAGRPPYGCVPALCPA